ncbi:MAG TPA: hypothetical protein PKM87_10535 [Methanolinea sp.]|nr:hypothetical protein [Methanolinea sp.]
MRDIPVNGFSIYCLIPNVIRKIPKPMNRMARGRGRISPVPVMKGNIPNKMRRSPRPSTGPPLSTPNTGYDLPTSSEGVFVGPNIGSWYFTDCP